MVAFLRCAAWPVCVMLVFAGAACASPTPMPTSTPVKITFGWHSPMDPAIDDWYAERVREFNESEPSIRVELAAPGTLNRDVATIGVEAEELSREFGSVLLPLDALIDAGTELSVDDFYAATLELFTNDAGELYAIPAYADPLVICYNKELFDYYSAPYPQVGWTWDDFLDAGLALRDAQANVFGYGSLDPYASDVYGGSIQYGDRLPGALWNATGDSMAVLRWYASLVHQYNVAPTVEQATDAFGTMSGVCLGKVGMWVDYFHSCGWAPVDMPWERTELSYQFGFAPLPQPACSLSLSNVYGYAILSQTEHPQESWRWIAYLSQQTPPLLVPARKSLAESPAYEQIVGREAAALAQATMEGASALMPADQLVREYEEIREWYLFREALAAILAGSPTGEEAMAKAEQELDEDELPIGGWFLR